MTEKQKIRTFNYSVGKHSESEEIVNHIKRNPINMEVDYIMDRQDNFFKIHNLNEGSMAFIARDSQTNDIAACVSLLKFQGRIGEGIIDFQYVTDLIKDREKSSSLTMQRLLNYALENYFDSNLVIGLVNEHNLKARLFSSSRHLSVETLRAGRFNYVELIPVLYHRFGSDIIFKSPELSEEMNVALEFINNHYKDYLLFKPLDYARLEDAFNQLPGFKQENIVMMYQNDQLQGVMIYYDPSPLVGLILDKMDQQTKILVSLVKFINRYTGLLFSPPGKGDALKTIQVRYLAGDKNSQKKLLCFAKNIAKAKGYHSVSLLSDEKEEISKPGMISFLYKSLMYIGYKKKLEKEIIEIDSKKLFLDITFT